MAVSDIRSNPSSNLDRRSPPGALGWTAMILMIVGGLNWGLVGLFDVDLVAQIAGDGTTASRVICALVGLAALYGLYLLARLGSRGYDGEHVAG